MPPLQPLQQTIFEQGPQSSVGMGASPIVDYREDPTIIVNPINPALALDNGVAWYALGAEAFNVAGKLYEETLNNVINGKDESIQAIGYDLQNKTDDLYQGFQMRLLQAQIAGTSLTQEDQETLNQKYEEIKGSYDTEARKVLGDVDYDRFTTGNPDLSDIGSRYRRLALQTRKSFYDIENNITKVMYDVASQQQQLTVKNESRTRFASGNSYSRSRQPPLTKEEIAENVPVYQLSNGDNPVTTNGGKPMMAPLKDGTTFGFDAAGNVLKDEKGILLMIQGKDGEYYMNPLADMQMLGEEGLTMLALADSQQGNLSDDTGQNIHPVAQDKFKALIEGRLPPADAYMAMVQLGSIDLSSITRLLHDKGGEAFTPADVFKLSIMHNMSNRSATQEQLIQFQQQDFNNPKAIMAALTWANSLTRGSVDMVLEGRQDLAGREDLLYGTGKDSSAIFTIANAMIQNIMGVTGANLNTFLVDANSKDKTDPTDGINNESMVDFFYANPQAKITLARAYLAILSDPSITKGGTTSTNKQRNLDIIKAVEKSFIPTEFAAASLSVVDGVIISSPTLWGFEDKVKKVDSIANKANLSNDNKDKYKKMSQTEKRKLVAQAEMLGTNGSMTLATDTNEVAETKALEYVTKFVPAVNKTVAMTLIGGIGQTHVSPRGTYLAKKGLNDGELARISMASNPIFYVPLGLVPNTPDAAAKVRALPVDDQIKLAAKAWKLILSGEHWDMHLDTSNRTQLEGNNAGIPAGVLKIPATTTTGQDINLVDFITSKDNLGSKGEYMFRMRDNNSTPLIRIGSRIEINNQLVDNTERNLDQNIKDILEAQAEGSKSNRDTVTRGVLFPSSTDTGVINDVRFIDSITKKTISKEQTNFNKYYTTKGIANPEVLSVIDLINQLELPTNKEAYATFRKLDPDFKDDYIGSSILDTIVVDYRRETQGESNTSTVFTPALMETVFAKAKGLGLKTVSDHLALLFEVAHGHRANAEYDMGYNLKEYRGGTEPLFNSYKPNTNGDILEEVFPDTMPMGPKFGMILWDENSTSFLPTLEAQIEAGNSIYTKTGTNEYYAFEKPPASPEYVLYHSSGTPAIEATPDTRVTTTERELVPQLGGWDGWGPRYDNVTKTTGTAGTPAQAATGKTTDLNKAFEKNRLHRLFLSSVAEGDTIVTGVDPLAYVAEPVFKAVQSDISRILAADWKTIKETPAKIGNIITDMENWKQNTPVGAMENEKRQSANDFGLWVRSKMIEPMFAAQMAVYKEFGRDGNIDRTTSARAAGVALGAYASDFFGVSGDDIKNKIKDPIVAAELAVYKEFGGDNNIDPSKSARAAGIALRAAFYSFFGMDEDVVDNLSHEQTVEIQKTIEAAPPSKIKNITLTAVELLHKEHMDAEAVPTFIARPPTYKDFVTEDNFTSAKGAKEVSPGAVGETKNRPDVEEPTVVISRNNFPVKLNKDGSVSTVVTMSFQSEKGGPEILIPTVVGGKQLTNKQAIDRYAKTGEHFGKFSTPEKATAYAKALHIEEEKSVDKNEKLWFDVIKTYEGFEAKAYNKDGKWTVGAGSTTHPDGTPVKKGDVIDVAKADMYVRHYTYNTVIPTLSNTIPSWDKMNANQQAALISFAYNMGPNFYGASERETITAALKSPLTWYKVPAALPLYNKARSQTSGKLVILQGLIKRRKTEADLWNQTK